MKNLSEEDMDKLMKQLENGLGKIFDGVANVKCVKGDSDGFASKIIDTFMNYPIVRLELSRSGSQVNVNKCSIQDVIDMLPNAIGSLLSLVPEEDRNDILYKAITENNMSKDGGLKERLQKERYIDEEEDEDYSED